MPELEDKYIDTCKWVFKVKRNSDENIKRHKARLVARGLWFLQKILAVVGQNQMSIEHFDAKTTFLNGRFTEDMYMRQPGRYTVPGKDNYVCKLNKGTCFKTSHRNLE